MKGLAGHGKAQSPLPLEDGQTYYSTIRAITGAGHVLEAISDGLTVDRSSPNIEITNFAGVHSSEQNLQYQPVANVSLFYMIFILSFRITK